LALIWIYLFYFCLLNSKWRWLEKLDMNLIFLAAKISNEHELKHIVRTKILPFFFCILDKFQLHLPPQRAIRASTSQSFKFLLFFHPHPIHLLQPSPLFSFFLGCNLFSRLFLFGYKWCHNLNILQLGVLKVVKFLTNWFPLGHKFF